jgi:hypothetical protein
MTTLRALLLLALALPAAAAAAPRDAFARRQRAESSVGFRLGAVTATHSASPDTLTAPGGGIYMLFDMPGLLVDVSADLFAGEDRARLVQAGGGAYYPFVDDETTPYAGGGVKVGWSRFGGDGAFGLQPFLGGGLLIGRSWSPSIRLDVAWFFTTASERRGPGFPSRHANGPMFTFGLGF